VGNIGSTKVVTMKKARKKSVGQKPAPGLPPNGKGKNGLISKQPAVKQEAAVAHGMFLYVDDAWSLRYFDQNDLHFKEREVFG
jgi:hypothetical protein